MKSDPKLAHESRRIPFSGMLWIAGIIILVTTIAVLGLGHQGSGESRKIVIIGAVLLLVLRQVLRRVKTRSAQASKPDPAVRLNLD